MYKTTTFPTALSVFASVCLPLAGRLTSTAIAQSGGPYGLSWSTVDGGGSDSTGGNYTLSGTIGQPDAHNHPQAMSGGSYRLTGGLWVIPGCVAVPADFDEDCDVDQADYQVFETCASGPGVPEMVNCEQADFDADGDVDQTDFAVLQAAFTGEPAVGPE